jgi:putative transposase
LDIKEDTEPKPYKPRDAIAVDINERKIVYGDHVINGERDIKIDEAHRWKKLAENLQKRYSFTRYPAWRRRKAILNRIRSYHRRLGIYWRTGLGKHLLRSWSYLRSLDTQQLERI